MEFAETGERIRKAVNCMGPQTAIGPERKQKVFGPNDMREVTVRPGGDVVCLCPGPNKEFSSDPKSQGAMGGQNEVSIAAYGRRRG